MDADADKVIELPVPALPTCLDRLDQLEMQNYDARVSYWRKEVELLEVKLAGAKADLERIGVMHDSFLLNLGVKYKFNVQSGELNIYENKITRK